MLLHAKTNEEYPTIYDFLTEKEALTIGGHTGWQENFDWSLYFKGEPDLEVYKLMVKGSDRIEGIIALQIREDHVFVLLAESAPHNRGAFRDFYRVGGHLFAIACQRSVEKGFDGYVALDAKTRLIQHYQTEYKMYHAFGLRMIIDEVAAQELIRLYLS